MKFEVVKLTRFRKNLNIEDNVLVLTLTETGTHSDLF